MNDWFPRGWGRVAVSCTLIDSRVCVFVCSSPPKFLLQSCSEQREEDTAAVSAGQVLMERGRGHQPHTPHTNLVSNAHAHSCPRTHFHSVSHQARQHCGSCPAPSLVLKAAFRGGGEAQTPGCWLSLLSLLLFNLPNHRPHLTRCRASSKKVARG